jgi:transcriptional regulator with XRE-family HTH domain
VDRFSARAVASLPTHVISIAFDTDSCNCQEALANAIDKQPQRGMMAREANPTLRRRELGARLRELRQGANLSIDDVSKQLLVSATKISRIETGARHAKLRDVRDICRLYKVGSEELDALMRLAKEAEEPSWWQQYDQDYSAFVGLEAAATAMSDFKCDVVPGLLQTDDYARAVLEATLPGEAGAQIEKLVQSRLIRQRRLRGDDSVRCWAVLDESALRRVVGGPAIMREQLETLIDHAGQPNIDIQVLAFEAGAHPALNSNFMILDFEEAVSDVVYVEGLLGKHYLQAPRDVARYRRVFDHLRAIAMSPRDSIAKMTAIAKSYAG